MPRNHVQQQHVASRGAQGSVQSLIIQLRKNRKVNEDVRLRKMIHFLLLLKCIPWAGKRNEIVQKLVFLSWSFLKYLQSIRQFDSLQSLLSTYQDANVVLISCKDSKSCRNPPTKLGKVWIHLFQRIFCHCDWQSCRRVNMEWINTVYHSKCCRVPLHNRTTETGIF